MDTSKLFYGIYRGICQENNDPLLKNRIKLQVPQVLGQAVTDWAYPCLPVTNNSNHPDHVAHLASDVAALLTTSVSNTGSGGSPSHTHSIPALTVVAKAGAGTLKHPHQTTATPSKKWNSASGQAYNDAANTYEHTPHRTVPDLKQGVWVMFEGGDPNHPVWLGVF